MAKRYVILAGVAGYLVAIWYYASAFAPVESDWARTLLSYICFSCFAVSGLHSTRLRMAFLLIGPVNAGVYAAIVFFFAKILATRSQKNP